ncbi:MAG: NAD-dependent epimerase/dehydratase family protein [Gemmatimonadota bacterium]|nr:NAD-dependent epimerase/dehydratase family protein [Gemmatimonadota bacterium]
MTDTAPDSDAELEERLSRPTAGLLDTLQRHSGDLVILGAGGKMGPTLARMARRGLEAVGSGGRVVAVSRFRDPAVAAGLRADGIDVIAADLLDPVALAALPDAESVIFMAGQKFGTLGAPAETWAMNAIVPSRVAERFAGHRTVVFSTGNVYPLTPAAGGGPTEATPPGPIGEYAMSCLARERIFEDAALRYGTPVALVRLNYAIDLRYGVLLDTARRVLAGQPVPLAMGFVNVIWQGDANARSLQCLDLAATPADVLNLTGPDTISVRWLAERFGEFLGVTPIFRDTEAPDALLSNARRSVQLFGPLTVDLEQMLRWTVDWLRRGGRELGKPTHFEARDGRF